MSRASAAQARLAVDFDRLGTKRLLDRLRVEAGEPERREQPERDGAAVRELEAGRRLERVRERVAEVELRALAAVVWVAQAEGRLEGSRPTHLLVERQLPDRLAHQQSRLDDLGAPVRELLLRQRLERRRVDHGPNGPVEGADDVLRPRQVDRRLAADRGVDLADERRRHGDPVDPAEVAGRGEPGDVGGAAAAERDEQAGALEPQRVPERLERLDRLRLLPWRELVDSTRARARARAATSIP